MCVGGGGGGGARWVVVAHALIERVGSIGILSTNHMSMADRSS